MLLAPWLNKNQEPKKTIFGKKRTTSRQHKKSYASLNLSIFSSKLAHFGSEFYPTTALVKTNNTGGGFPFLIMFTIVTFAIAVAGWYVYSKQYPDAESGGVAGIIKTVEVTDVEVEENFDHLGEFKTYNTEQDDRPKVTFEYPDDWFVKAITTETSNAGVIADIVSPEQHLKYLNGETKVDSDMFVSFWKDINNSYALGGNWDDKREYKDLDDYITSPEFGYKKSLKTTVIDERKAHIVTIGGQGESYGVMIETDKGIFEFNFASTFDEEAASDEVRKIISTIDIH